MKKIIFLALFTVIACRTSHIKKEVKTEVQTEKKTFDSIYNLFLSGNIKGISTQDVKIEAYEEKEIENVLPNYPNQPIVFDGGKYKIDIVKTSQYDSVFVVSKRDPEDIKMIGVSDSKGSHSFINIGGRTIMRKGINIQISNSNQTTATFQKAEHKEVKSTQSKTKAKTQSKSDYTGIWIALALILVSISIHFIFKRKTQ